MYKENRSLLRNAIMKMKEIPTVVLTSWFSGSLPPGLSQVRRGRVDRLRHSWISLD